MKMAEHYADQDDDLAMCSWEEWRQRNDAEAMLSKWELERPRLNKLQQIAAAEKAELTSHSSNALPIGEF